MATTDMKPNIQIIPAQDPQQLADIRSLLEAYGHLRKHDAALGDYQAELDTLPGKYGPPEGCLLGAWEDENIAGCVAYRKIGEGICEMKRLYVSPAFRGKKIGEMLVEVLLDQAKASGYQLMRLDTHPWMTHAQQLYHSFGFEQVPAYHYNPTPGITFYERALD